MLFHVERTEPGHEASPFLLWIPNIAGFDIIKISLEHAGCSDADPLQHVGAKE